KGVIYSTPSTRDISEVMFADSVKIIGQEAKKEDVEPLYDDEDVAKTMSLWKTVKYHENTDIGGGFSLNFKDAGHILGSAIAEVTHKDKKIVFTGDLGNTPAPILRDTEKVEGADYMVMESVYGDRNHEDKEERRAHLKQAILDIKKRGGVLMIPAFSIQRTQLLLYEINNFVEEGEIDEIPVYLDSPLAIKVTNLYQKYPENFNESVKKEISEGDNIFEFPKLSFTPRVEESKSIAKSDSPKIVIAGSGMSMGGRILHHEKKYLEDKNNILLIVGYQAAGTLGRRIQDGAKEIEIMEQNVFVRAEVRSIHGFSAHKDSENLLSFVEDSSDTLRKVFVCMGEPKSSSFLAQRIRDFLDVESYVPEKGESIEIEI
ncbi:MAG: MBL fold metallo-hydrolase, partial [Candidatus Pacebacteria bacterium]|nr:MBL fold metallo-hydrolase [Candidatus Paceibacterota bacterium]